MPDSKTKTLVVFIGITILQSLYIHYSLTTTTTKNNASCPNQCVIEEEQLQNTTQTNFNTTETYFNTTQTDFNITQTDFNNTTQTDFNITQTVFNTTQTDFNETICLTQLDIDQAVAQAILPTYTQINSTLNPNDIVTSASNQKHITFSSDILQPVDNIEIKISLPSDYTNSANELIYARNCAFSENAIVPGNEDLTDFIEYGLPTSDLTEITKNKHESEIIINANIFNMQQNLTQAYITCQIYLCDPANCDECTCNNGAVDENQFCNNANPQFCESCSLGYIGDTCENINECELLDNLFPIYNHTTPCFNGGQCVDNVGFYSCSCPAGFTGDHCQYINECSSNPCQLQNSVCIDEDTGFYCLCFDGFTGTHCEIDIDECQSNPCTNGAQCVDNVAFYSCTCQPGWTGSECQTNINECDSNPCVNSVACIDGDASYSCVCSPGFTDVLCDVEINECDSNPCMNNGVCIDSINTFSCECQNGYFGAICNLS